MIDCLFPVFQLLQSSLKEKSGSFDSQGVMIERLTSKVESSEERIALLEEQLEESNKKLHGQSGDFDMKLRETQTYFEETLTEKDTEISRLIDVIGTKDQEIQLREEDLRQLIVRQERELQRLVSKGEVNIQDEVLKMLEQKLKDTNEVLSSKAKVIQVLQAEVAEKEKVMATHLSAQRSLKEKYDMTREQMRLMQENFVSIEATWKADKAQLEAMRAATEQQRQSEVSQLHAGLTQYQTAYSQVAAQYQQVCQQLQQQQAAQPQEQLVKQLQEQIQQLASSSGEQQQQLVSSLQESLSSQLTAVSGDQEEQKALRQQILDLQSATATHQQEQDTLQAKLTQAHKDLEEAKAQLTTSKSAAASSETPDSPSRPDAKLLKYKAQATAKIKKLEKQLEELKQVGCISFNLNYCCMWF